MLTTCGVQVQPTNTDIREQRRQFFFHTLGAETAAGNMGRSTCRTDLSRVFRKAAIVAVQLSAAFVVGQAYVAMDALGNMPAGIALGYRCVSPAILKKNDLSLPGDGIFYFLQQLAAEIGKHVLPAGFFGDVQRGDL